MPLLTDETQLTLHDLKQGIAVERRHRFVDVMGRRYLFSAFVVKNLKALRRWELDAAGLNTLIARFERYNAMDVSARMTAIDTLETYLQSAKQPAPQAMMPASQRTNPKTLPPKKPLKAYVHDLKGVGPKLARQLQSLGLHTVEQLLYYPPRQYLDYQNHRRIVDLTEGELVSTIARVVGINHFDAKTRNLTVVRLKVRDTTGIATASWFFSKQQQGQVHAFKARFPQGTEVLISGKVKWDSYSRCPQIDKAEVEVLDYEESETAAAVTDSASLHAGRIVPVYPLTQGLSVKPLRRAIRQALDLVESHLEDPLPDTLRKQYQLQDLYPALCQLHFPDSQATAQTARHRLVFDELFYLQAQLALLRSNYKQAAEGLALKVQTGSYVDRFQTLLPFSLTGAQQRAFGEIDADLGSAEPMNRLLHGDVGSGKTVVAALTLLRAVENGYQAAIMAPTEILAEQHYQRFVEWFTPLGLKVVLVVGKSGAKVRRQVRQELLSGQAQIAVGTHALIQDDVEFANLGVIVVDEQHRFGVRQRLKLREKGSMPELLTMTATPIPRTLTMTLHGDLDVSKLDELPPGRSPIHTKLLRESQRKQAYDVIRLQVLQGRQAYIVFPLIEESESLAAKAATSEAKRLQEEIFPELRIGLLHGKLKADEKEAIMAEFAKGETHILVATTVVEVGVDVPNATIIVIESADRFGLAQLHQLRGRVGRGQHASSCFLVSSTKNEETAKRLKVMEETTDGFVIAEQDLAIRGPGEYLGTRQSGLPELILADLLEDEAILTQAREAAFTYCESMETLATQPALQQAVLAKSQAASSTLRAG